MKAYEVIYAVVQKRGIPIAELSRRVGIDSELLRRSLSGNRKIGAAKIRKRIRNPAQG